MSKIDLTKSQNKTMITVIGAMAICGGLFIGSRFILPDDTPIMDTWRTSIYMNMGYQVQVSDVTFSKETGETFFTLVQSGVPYSGENIKLSLHSINDDGSLSPIQNISQLTLESDEKSNLKMTGYSFFAPTNTYHLQVTITALDSNNRLLNQQVIYIDTRKMEVEENSFTMQAYVERELDEYLNPPVAESTNKVKNPVATTEGKSDAAEITGDDIQTPNNEIQEPVGTLQQTYVIDHEEIQSDHDGHDHDNESEIVEYTLEDLEHQLSKAQEELKATPDDEVIKTTITEIEKQIQDMKDSESNE